MIEETKTIYDSNNKILLTIPNNTTLDYEIECIKKGDYDYELDGIDDSILYLYTLQDGWLYDDLCVMIPDI
jgi:hypothetical protein